MRWVRHVEPLVLSQESDIPYVVHDNGILLCFDNIYREGQRQPLKTDEFFIEFKTSQQAVMRQSTYFYRFYDFPLLIPFNDVVHLNETIIDGKLLKIASYKDAESSNIAVVKENYVTKLSDDEFQDFAESIGEFDKSFMLVGDNIDTNIRLLSDIVETVHHADWGRTCVTIAHRICESAVRKYCWTKSVPNLDITTYGFKPEQDTEKLYKMFSDLDIEVTTNWGG
jgi:hypothetical protein